MVSHSAMPVDCLVCGKRTEATHMGMNACRACAVFYKRNHKKADKLECVNGSFACLDYGRSVFWCRKCRLNRFEAVLRVAWGEDTSAKSSNTSHSPQQQIDIEMTPPQTPHPSIIDKIRENHHVLSNFRCASELALRGIEMNSGDVNEENYPIVPCTYQFMEEATKILIPGLFNFAQSTFPGFEHLKPAEKWLLIRNYEKIFHCIDAELRTLRRFGKRSTNIFGTYTTCMYLEYVEHYFSDCPNVNSIPGAAKTLHDFLQINVSETKKQVHAVDPTEEEFLAMIGLALWSVENVEASDALLELASRYRTDIMTDLSAHYRRNIGEEKRASRMGAIMCLLQEFRRLVMSMRSDYEIYYMLGAYDESTLMYKLPVL